MDEIARGREAVVYALDDRRILRRSLDDRQSADPSRLTEYLRSQGYPVPEVFESDGRDVIMERIDGPDLLTYVAADPARLDFVFELLGDLHNRLATIAVPAWLDELAVSPRDDGLGDHRNIVHLDFHPGNVILADDGPRVIDWSNVHSAPHEVDVAFTDLVLRTAPEAAVFPRDLLERALAVFASITGVDPAVARGTAIAFRLRDPGLSAAERDAVATFDGR